jgi:hypothetical protein
MMLGDIQLYNTHIKSRKKYSVIGLEVLTAVTIKNSTFRDILLYSPVTVNPCLGGACLLHLKVEK